MFLARLDTNSSVLRLAPGAAPFTIRSSAASPASLWSVLSATLIQIYTGLIYAGPGLVKKILVKS